MKRAALFVCLLSVTPAGAATLRDNYENCVMEAYLDLAVQGAPASRLTAERAVQGCETELQALYSLLINTNMDPRLALSMVTNIRLSAKRRMILAQ